MADVVPITAGSGYGVASDEIATNLTGTVSKNATTTVTGVGSAFLTELAVGAVIRIPGGASTEDRVISAIASNTSLTVSVAFTTTASTQVGQRVDFAQRTKAVWGPEGSIVDASTSNPLPVVETSKKVALLDTTQAWANSDAANTTKTLTLDGSIAAAYVPGHYLAVIIKNPSTETALLADVQATWTDPSGGTTRYANLSSPGDLATFSVLSNNGDGQVFVVENPLLTTGRLILKNQTALSGSGGFTASVQAWAI